MKSPVLVTGATGQLGAYVVRELQLRGQPLIAWGFAHADDSVACVDLANRRHIEESITNCRPAAIIHCAAVAAVAECARDPLRAELVNANATAVLARVASQIGARLVYTSTDLVFDGEHAPYSEMSRPKPRSEYGRTKYLGEMYVQAFRQTVVARLSLLFGPPLNGRDSFFGTLIAAFRSGQRVQLFHNEWRTPLSYASAASSLVDLASSNFTGIVHLAGPERMSRVEMGQRLAAYIDADQNLIDAVGRETAPGEPRPRDTSLLTTNKQFPQDNRPRPTFEQALEQMQVPR